MSPGRTGRAAGAGLVSAELRERLGDMCAALDLERVRVVTDGPLHALVHRLSGGRDVTLGNRVYAARAYDPDDPREVARAAHELMHVAQYQAWGPLRYYARGVAARLREWLGGAPYDWSRRPAEFERRGMEEQAQIVEDAFRGDPRARELSPFLPPSAPRPG